MPYDTRAASSATSNRAALVPQYFPSHSYTGLTSSNLVVTQQQLQHNPFNSSSYSAGNALLPFNNYIQPRPLPRLMQHNNDESRVSLVTRNTRQGFVEEPQSQSPPIKSEPSWTSPNDSSITSVPKTSKTISMTLPTNGASEVTFSTNIDVLMKVIQAKELKKPQSSSSINRSKPVVGTSLTIPHRRLPSYSTGMFEDEGKFKLTHESQEQKNKAGKKQYVCVIEDCHKCFYQKTHLDIHVRAHTGYKPYVSFTAHMIETTCLHLSQPCGFLNCDSRFSQLGNLRASPPPP